MLTVIQIPVGLYFTYSHIFMCFDLNHLPSTSKKSIHMLPPSLIVGMVCSGQRGVVKSTKQYFVCQLKKTELFLTQQV